MEEDIKNFLEICKRRVNREELPDDPKKFEEICHCLQEIVGRLVREAAKDKITDDLQCRLGFEFQLITLVRDLVVNSTQAFVYLYKKDKPEILKEENTKTD